MAWEVKKLGEIAKINYGYTEKASFDEIGPKFLRITDIQDNDVEWSKVPFCKCSESDLPKYKLETGDIVFARTGATTGKSFLLNDPPNSVFASYLIRLKLISKKDIVPEFVSYYFQTKAYWDKINTGISGSTQGGFNASKLGKLLFSYPKSITEQKRIVAILDEAFESIIKAKESAEKNLRNAKEIFESYLQSVFENKGEGWGDKTLGEVCEYDKNHNKKSHLPYVGLEHIESNSGKFIGLLEPQNVKSSTFNFTDKHVLYGRLRPYLNKVLLPNFEGHCSTEIFPIVVNEHLNRTFLFRWLMYGKTVKKINATCTGARMPRANMNKVLELIIPLPPLSIQQALVTKLDALSTETKKLKAIYEKKLADLEDLKKSILQKAFDGELK